MNYEHLLLAEQDHVLTITINRPSKLNALNFELMEEIEKCFRNISVEIRCVIITGSGDKAFVAGADIKEIAKLSTESAREVTNRGQYIFSLIENCTRPVIAAINGYALGGGCELAMACHIRIASENAVFAQPEINLGIIPGYGGTQRLTTLTNRGMALEMMLTGNKIDATTALRIGLVNHVVKPEELISTTNKLASKIVKQPAEIIKLVLETVNASFKDLDYTTEAINFAKCAETDSFKEGTSAFFEKRKAEFNKKKD